MPAVKPTVLYPFSITADFEGGLIWAEELAQRMAANLVLLTAVAQRTEEQVMRVYDAVLRAQGHPTRLEHPPHIRPDVHIEAGTLPAAIQDHLKENLVDVLVLDPHLPVAIELVEAELVDAANSTIRLQADTRWAGQPRSFFMRLQKAEIHKLPDHLYRTLSNDPGFFNFLGALFRR